MPNPLLDIRVFKKGEAKYIAREFYPEQFTNPLLINDYKAG